MENISLRVLCLEDNPQDAEIIQETLIDAGYNLNWDLASTKEQFEALLRNNRYDVILSDFKLPGFDAFGALQFCKEICPETPFICVSGSIGEEIAIELIKQGANDYILKDRLVRLTFAIKRALEEVKEKESRRQVEEALLTSERRFQTLANISPVGIFQTNAEGSTTYVNPRWCQISGMPKEEALGMGWLKAVHVEDKEKLRNNWERVTEVQDSSVAEYRFVRNDGSIAWVMGQAIPERDADNKIVGYVGTITDITERKLAEESLAKERQRLSYILEGTNVGTWEWNVQTGETIFNERWAEIIGYTLNELVPVSIDTWTKFAHPDDLKKSDELLKKHFRKELQYYECEVRMHHKNGNWVWVLDRGKVATWTTDGKPLIISGTHQDITERKLAEESLVSAEHKYRTIFENVEDVYYETSIDGTILVVSPSIRIASRGQYQSKELIGKSIYDFYSDIEQRQTFLSSIRERGSVSDYEIIFKNRDGLLIPCSVSAKFLFDDQGHPEKIIGSMRDISRRKRSEKITTALYDISKAVYTSDNLDTLFPLIHHALSSIISADNFFIALIDKTGENLIFPYEVDENPGDSPIIINIHDSRSLTVAMIQTREPLLLDEQELNERYAGGKSRLWNAKPKCWMGVPLLIQEQVIGAMAVQRYDKAGVYTTQDVKLFSVAAEQVAIAIQRKRAEEELQDSEIKYRMLFDKMTTGLAVHEIILDNKNQPIDYRFLQVNPAFEQLIGLSAETILGRTVLEVLPDTESSFIKRYGEVALTGKDIQFESYSQELKKYFNIRAYSPERRKFATIFEDITKRKRAEEELQKLANVINYSSEMVNLITLDGKMIFLNEAGSKMLGISPTEIEQTHIMQFIPGNYKDIVKNELFPTLLKTGTWNGDMQYLNIKTGQLTDAHTMAFIIKDLTSGAPLYMACIALDITERKQAEEAVRESEERYRKAEAIGHVGSWEYDIQATSFWGSEEAKRIYGFDMNADAFTTDEVENCIPERKRVHKALIDLIEYNKEYNLEFDIITKDKHKRKTIISIASLEQDEAGRPLKVTGVIQDITERKQAEEKVNQLAAIVQSSDDAIIGKTLDGIITSWNKGAENIYGYTESEVIGKSISLLIPNGSNNEIPEILAMIRSGTHIDHYETVRLTKDNRKIQVSLTISPIRDSAGEIVAASTIARDITDRKKAEEALQNEQLLLRTIIDNIPDAIYTKDLSCRKTLANKAELRHMKAKSEKEILGKDDFEWYPKELAEKFFADDQSVLKTGESVINREEYIFDEKGQKLCLLSSKLPLLDKNNQIIGLLGIGRNITERKLAEDRQIFTSKILSILNRPNKWQQIINDILSKIKIFTDIEAIAIRLKEGEDYPYFVTNGFPSHFAETEKSLCARDSNGKIIYDTSGVPYLECLCGNIISGRTDPSLPIYTSEGSFWTNSTTELLATYTEKELQTVTRNRCNIEGYESVALIPLKSGEKVIGLLQFNDKRTNRFTLDMIQFFEKVGSTIGIAYKRMQSEKQIRESEERYRFIVEATNVVLYRLRYDSMKYVYINPVIEKLTGYTPEEINEIGFRNIVVKISKYHIENVNINLIVEDREEGKTGEWQADYQVRTKYGKLIWLSDHSYPWHDKANNLIGSVGILNDITERKQAEEEIMRAKEKAEEMNRLKSSFLANMSHELRTPLIGILGFADILKEEIQDEERRDYAKIIFESGTRLKETLNLILDLSKIESRVLELNLEEVELTGYIPVLVKVFQKATESKGLKLKIIPGKELIFCRLDKILFDSIINNLLNNAVKYTQKGKIIVKIGKIIEKELVKAEILIEDTGIGISQENLAIIFEPFRQVSEGLNRKFEGTGLGLTLVKNYVEKMNGNITVESKVGEGSKFRIRFPILKSEFKKSEKEVVEIKRENNSAETAIISKPLILYVEDDIISQKVISTITGNSYRIEIVDDGEKAIELVKKKKYDIILMDINLGGKLNGLETTQIIKRIEGYENTPIIAVTAYTMAGDKEKILMQGCTHYISKPFTRNEFLSLLSVALNQ